MPVEKKCHIKDIAGNMFLKLGFKSVTMDDICREIGMSKKTLYKYFPNKKELVRTCILGFEEELKDVLENIGQLNLNSVEELFAIEKFFENHFLFEVDLSPSFQLKKHYPDILNEMKCQVEGDFDVFMYKNLDKGISEGLFREGINKEMCYLFFRTLKHQVDAEKQKDAVKMHYEIIEYHVRAIGTPKGIEELEKQLQKKEKNYV
jgi:AcrR family transcriptional regulator